MADIIFCINCLISTHLILASLTIVLLYSILSTTVKLLSPAVWLHLDMSLTWKRELWPCSRAGLSGATGLRLLQKWMPDNSGL